MDAYARYGPALVRKCQRMLLSRSESEDIVHGLFVDLLEKGRTDLDLPYLYRAVTNRCLNLLRDNETKRRLLSEHDVALRGPVRTLCEDQVIELDLLEKLRARLDEKCAEVLVYRYIDDLGVEEIADLVGTSRKTVGKRLEKIRVAVRALLSAGVGS